MRLILSSVLAGVFLLLYVLPLGVRPLVIPDEARYAEIPREMLASGDWIVPHLNGLRYFEKPPLGYWLNAAAIWLFGENAFAIRFPSAVAVGLTALLLFMWARRFTGDDATPLLATAVFLLSFEVLAIGVFGVLDSVLSLFVTAAIVALSLAYEQQTPRTRVLLLVLAGMAGGLALLTKGFLALAMPVIVFVPFALWQGRLKNCLRTAWVPLSVAVLVALPWGILIHRREPDFWRYFFWVEHVHRFISPERGQHASPIWFYVPILVAGAMPWTPLVGTIVQGLRHTNRNQPMIRLAVCWLVLPFLLFSASSGKLGTYILPCFPPLAFLIAVGVLRCLGEGDAMGFVVGTWALMLGAGSLLVALIVALFTVPGIYDRVTLWSWMIAAAGLLFWVVFCRAAATRNRVYSRLALYCAGPVLFMFSWHFIAAGALSPKKAPGAFLVSNASRILQNDIIVSENSLTAALGWYYNRSDILILDGGGEYAYGLGYEDSRHRLLDVQQSKNLIAGPARENRIILVVGAKRYAQYEGQLPRPCHVERCDGLVWAEYPPPARAPISESANSAGVP